MLAQYEAISRHPNDLCELGKLFEYVRREPVDWKDYLEKAYELRARDRKIFAGRDVTIRQPRGKYLWWSLSW